MIGKMNVSYSIAVVQEQHNFRSDHVHNFTGIPRVVQQTEEPHIVQWKNIMTLIVHVYCLRETHYYIT